MWSKLELAEENGSRLISVAVWEDSWLSPRNRESPRVVNYWVCQE